MTQLRDHQYFLDNPETANLGYETDASEPKITRQEEKDSVDLIRMLTRGGAIPDTRPQLFGDANYTYDLQQALEAKLAAQRLLMRIPEKIRRQYDNTEQMLEALDKGTLAEEITDHFNKEATRPSQTSPNSKPEPSSENSKTETSPETRPKSQTSTTT